MLVSPYRLVESSALLAPVSVLGLCVVDSPRWVPSAAPSLSCGASASELAVLHLNPLFCRSFARLVCVLTRVSVNGSVTAPHLTLDKATMDLRMKQYQETLTK
jgi:hypothetical protein